MNNRLKFDKQVGWAVAINDKDVLLGYLVSDTKYDLPETIVTLESVEKGEKPFEDFLDYSEGWSIADGFGGIFTCDQKTAYFTANGDSSLPSMQMPLKELIEILYDWKAFLGK